MSPREDIDFSLLRQLTTAPAASQRSLASSLGISVGKVNYCLRSLVDMGWIKVNNFRRSDNKWAYAYVLTPSGAAAKIRLTAEFLKRREKEYGQLVEEIEALRAELTTDVVARDHGSPSNTLLRSHGEQATGSSRDR